MTEPRPDIPADLERALMIEAGYRCAVCKTPEPLQIDHITEWTKVREHKFENMIVLCAGCHGRKKSTSKPRHINRASLRRIKANLMMLNGRYSDLERRVLDAFRDALAQDPASTPSLFLPERLNLLVRYLHHDGLVTLDLYVSPVHTLAHDGTLLRDDTVRVTLTPEGRAFIERLDKQD